MGFIGLQCPGAAILYKCWPTVERTPVASILLLFGYELMLCFFIFFRDLWIVEFDKDAKKTVANAIRSIISSGLNAVRNYSPGFHRRYRQRLRHAYELFNDRGLGLIAATRLDLRQVFVELRIGPSLHPNAANADLIAPLILPGNRPIWDFVRSLSFAKTEGVGFAILGAPGTGKTTLLHYMLLVLADNRQWQFQMRARVPILLSLRHCVDQIIDPNPPTLGALVESQIRKQFDDLNVPSGWFERRLKRGKCLVMLDGLDEEADDSKRIKVSTWVNEQIGNYWRCCFLVTSRPLGYKAAPLGRVHVLEIQTFDPEQVRRFIHNWYFADEAVRSGSKYSSQDVRKRARASADDLLFRLAAVPALNELTVNPLLLTMIVMVHRYKNKLPENRVQLYSGICQVLLDRWRGANGKMDSLSGDQKLIILRSLAAYMMEHELKDISTDEALRHITPLFRRVNLPPEKRAKFLIDLQESSGLLLEREKDQWAFAHKTFQEYLTASHWIEKGDLQRDWNRMVLKDWWFETLRLYAALKDATPIVSACLEHQSVLTLSLAWDCFVESLEMEEELRGKVEVTVIQALQSISNPNWVLAAEVVLSRRLARNFRPLDKNHQIDSAPVTCAEYQLFLDEQHAQGHYHQPDHWDELHFQDGTGQDPLLGLRPSDAHAFCKWLTARQVDVSWRYRLPFASEFRDAQVQSLTLCGVWGVQDGGQSTLLGLNEGLLKEAIAILVASLHSDPLYSQAGLEILTRDTTPTLRTILMNHDLALKIDLNYARNLAHALDLKLNLDLTHNLDLTRDLDIIHDLERDRDLAHERTRSLARALAHDLARDLAVARDLTLAITKDISSARTFGDKLGRDLDHDRELSSNFARNCIRNPNPDPIRDRVIDKRYIANEINVVHEFALTIDFDFDATRARAGSGINEYVHEVCSTTRQLQPVQACRLLMMKSLAEVLLAKSNMEQRRAKQSLYALMSVIAIQAEAKPTSSLFHHRSNAQGTQQWLRLYWWLELQILRAEDKLEPWEGLLLVRERI